MPNSVDVLITYLEQNAQPFLRHPTTTRKTAIMRAENPPVHFYRYLYNTVGGPHHWVSRKRLSDETLREIIHHPDDYIYVLYCDGAPAGMCEIDARAEDLAEIKFFGLAPEYVGAGLGRFFLTHAIRLAWALEPKRVILETCTLDHPAALPLYQKLGFTVFDQRHGVVSLTDEDEMRHI
ncbi:MAG: GNAT family N-acetyltransferase [Pseudomonadota bacterium]